MTNKKSHEELAVAIVQRLTEAGFVAYFAGGWVRDFLLDHASSDIDIATNAPPAAILSLFPKTICVGLHFGVVIVVSEGFNFEVSTFRKDLEYKDGRHPEGVEFSTAEEDAKRRDFTINGMFFDPLKEQVLDYVEGQSDLKKGVIRAIGCPLKRFEEDRLRMLRAVRFAARFNFNIEAVTKAAIIAHAHHLLPAVSMERIWQELTKMSKLSHFHTVVYDLYELKLLTTIFPDLASFSMDDLEKFTAPFSDFPSQCPTILYIQELFPNYSLDERLNLCKYLKTNNFDIKLVDFYHHSLELLHTSTTNAVTWTHFYAHPYAELLLEICAAKCSTEERTHFLHFHEKQQQQLFVHIERVASKKPLVTADHLLHLGVAAGKPLGELLKEAEKLAIYNNCQTADEVLQLLAPQIKNIRLLA